MGLLDNSTNNILVDAVLTEKGREAFASNGANLDEAGLVIVKFALADDEVDYENLQKYGLELGRSRIESLTPVFESSTNPTYALRSFLTSFSDSDLQFMPRITLEGGSEDGQITLNKTSGESKTLTFSTTVSGGLRADQVDSQFLVQVPGRFLQINLNSIGTNPDLTVIYQIQNSSLNSGIFSFTISVKQFGDELFSTFGTGSPDTIRTRIRLTGISTGVSLELPINIQRV